jgi:predicted nucleic acid-binding protein
MEVGVPESVAKECCGPKKTLDALRIQRAFDESKIKIMQVSDRRLVNKLQAQFSLGRGEAEAIALALQEKARLVAIDDKNGINACKFLALEFTTAIGILLLSKKNGLVNQAGALSKLAVFAKYGRYKDSIIQDARLKLEALT